MATLSVLPPLASSPLPIHQAAEETAADERHAASSPCGSIRIHRPDAAGTSQENIEVCAAATTTAGDKRTGSAALAAAAAAAAAATEPSTGPLKFVSTSPACASEGGIDSSIRCVPSNRQSEDIYTAWSPTRRGPRTSSLDDFVDSYRVEEALRSSIDSVKAFMSVPEPKVARAKRPFRKWVQTFNRRRTERQRSNQMDTGALPTSRTIGGSSYRRHSSSVSSFAYVSGIREASISGFGTTSIVPSSRKQATRSSKVLSKTDHSSRFSVSARQSDDDTANDRQKSLAEAHIVARSIQRRRILEELIETEEGYIGDIKFLMNAYMTIFASSPSADAGLRLSMYSNLTDIVELHDQILGELHRAIPDSEYSHLSYPRSLFAPPMASKRKSTNLDAVSEDKPQRPPRNEVTEMTITPEIAAKAASVFIRRIDRFYIYEEYRAKLDMVLDDLKMTYRSIPNWGNHQKGLEALASCLSYARDWQDSKRALSIDDLLAKPIQRACRYPLLFQELLKSTPVCDCPRSHFDIEHALERLHEVTVAMNKATDDPFFKSHLEKTWILQERLKFPANARNGASKSQIRLFGRIYLCGVLHVCWQTQASVRGSYMICLLFHSWLCFAVVDKTGKTYELQACVPLGKCSLEKADNGKGLQCHSAPFSWKVAFESSGQMYEVLMTASTKREEDEWRHRISDSGIRDSDSQYDHPAFTFLGLDIKALGAAHKTSDNPLRKQSIRRATTVPPKVQLFQVILKNTSSEKGDSQSIERQPSLGRSHSVLRASRIPVIAPSRGDRARLESVIADVWTRDVLMSSSFSPRVRGERMMRPSASAMMRKINVPSLTGTFGRRSLPRPPAAAPSTAARAADESSESTPKAPPSPRQRSSDHRMRLSLGHARLRHHERDDKAEQASVTIREDTAKARASSSLGDDDGKAYALAGRAEESYSAVPTSATPKTMPTMPSMPSMPPMPLVASSATLRAAVARPRSSGGASANTMASVAGELLTASTTYEMMAPLTRRGYREYREDGRESRGSRESREETGTKPSSRRWLKRPSLHRASLHRTLKKIQH